MSSNIVTPNDPNGPSRESLKTSRREAKAAPCKVQESLIVDPNESDLTKSVSVAVGIFISIVPLWGFQTIVAVAAAFVLRLNKPLVIAASITLAYR